MSVLFCFMSWWPKNFTKIMDFNILSVFTVILILIIVGLLYRQSRTPVFKNSQSLPEEITNEIELEAQNSTFQYGRLEHCI